MGVWKLLRRKSDLSDDPGVGTDYFGALGSQQIQSYDIESSIESTITKMAVGFFGADGRLVIGDRGTFSYQFLELAVDYDDPAQAEVFPIDSVLLTCGIGYRSILVPPFSEGLERATIRLQDIVAPAGAVGVKILYKDD